LLFLTVNIAVRVWVPQEGVIRVPWLAPAIEAVLLVVLFAANPGTPAERRRLRRGAPGLVGLLLLGALWSAPLLIRDIIEGKGNTNDPGELLASGALVWVGNNLAFAMLYWLVDGGGPYARSQRPTPLDFAFTQHMSPELAPPGWRPVFLDYVH